MAAQPLVSSKALTPRHALCALQEYSIANGPAVCPLPLEDMSSQMAHNFMLASLTGAAAPAGISTAATVVYPGPIFPDRLISDS